MAGSIGVATNGAGGNSAPGSIPRGVSPPNHNFLKIVQNNTIMIYTVRSGIVPGIQWKELEYIIFILSTVMTKKLKNNNNHI